MDHHLCAEASAGVATTRTRAVVSWYSPDRGFGFLAPDDGTDNVFVTWSSLPGAGFRSLGAGQPVTFVRARDQHGPTAQDVRLLDG